MTLEELAVLKLEAETVALQVQDSMSQLVRQLEEPVPLSVGRSIIKEIWGDGVCAAKLVSRLSACFPSENSGLIKHAELPKELSEKSFNFNERSAKYVEESFTFIKESINTIVGILNGYAPEDEIGVAVALNFRKESMRFIDAIKNGDFLTSDVEAMTEWGEFRMAYISYAVDEGDYMFINDFVPEMEATGKLAVIKRALPSVSEFNFTLSNVEFDCGREVCVLKLIYLYCEFLDKLTKMEE